MIEPVRVAEDRSLSIPPGHRIETGYVHVDQIKFACRARMAIGDVEKAYAKRLQLGSHQPWPCPRGHWEGDRFVVIDGRHECTAAIMLGHEWILVAWPVVTTSPAASS